MLESVKIILLGRNSWNYIECCSNNDVFLATLFSPSLSPDDGLFKPKRFNVSRPL